MGRKSAFAAALVTSLTFHAGEANSACDWDIRLTERDLKAVKQAAPLALDPELPLRRQSAGLQSEKVDDIAMTSPADEHIALARRQLDLARQNAVVDDGDGCAEAIETARDALTAARAAFR